jgi:hypothetical protein
LIGDISITNTVSVGNVTPFIALSSCREYAAILHGGRHGDEPMNGHFERGLCPRNPGISGEAGRARAVRPAPPVGKGGAAPSES